MCVEGPADPDGRWTAKDHLAHLAWWRSRNARLLEAVRTGGEPPPPVEDDAQNATVYAASRDRSLAEVKADAAASWVALRAAEACTEDDLAKPHPHAPGLEVWELVPGDGGHIGTHLMFWYLANGDESHAEAAQVWAYRLESDAFPDPVQRADAAYNLACFYARVGRARDALPLLRASLQAKPALVALARRDPDLDSIRHDPELKELLAT